MNRASVAPSQPTLLTARAFQQLQVPITRATFCMSVFGSNVQKVQKVFVGGLTVAACNTPKWLKSSALRLSEKSRRRLQYRVRLNGTAFGDPSLTRHSRASGNLVEGSGLCTMAGSLVPLAFIRTWYNAASESTETVLFGSFLAFAYHQSTLGALPAPLF